MARDLHIILLNNIMENSELQAKWPQIKNKIQAQYPSLKEDDLKYEIGRESELLLRLQQKLGKTNSEIKNWLSLLG